MGGSRQGEMLQERFITLPSNSALVYLQSFPVYEVEPIAVLSTAAILLLRSPSYTF